MPLEIRFSTKYLDWFEQLGENENPLNPIEQMAQVWNLGHPDIDFFSLPFISTEEKDYLELKEYRDDEWYTGWCNLTQMGIYASSNWFPGLTSGSLGITQFFGVRKNRGTESEYIELVHADIILNFRDHDFSLVGDKEKYDLLTIILHEMGHMIGLPHPKKDNPGPSVMAPRLAKGEVKRKLLPPDLKALLGIYPTDDLLYFLEISKIEPLDPFVTPEEERFIIEFMPNGTRHLYPQDKIYSP